MTVTNSDLLVMLTEIKGDIKCITGHQTDIFTWQKAHEEKQEKKFSELSKNSSRIAGISTCIGYLGALGTEFFFRKGG